MPRPGDWAPLEREGPEMVLRDGVALRAGTRVRVHPAAGGDIFDLALAGRVAVVERIEQDAEGAVHVAVTLEDDPGRELGRAQQIGHRFFFAPAELEPLGEAGPAAPAPRRVLVAGIGIFFLAEAGFGVEVAGRLAREPVPAGVQVADFGIRGMDLVYALQENPDVVVFLDAAPRGQRPGTLSVLEPGPGDGEVALDTHGMDPVKVLGLARAMGARPGRVLVVACEPQTRITGEEDEVVMELSEPVRAATDAAVRLVRELLDELTAEGART
jgi:hydrogenase maturation protease